MRIGIDIRELTVLDTKAGWYQYTLNLVLNLLAADSSNDYVLLSTLRGFDGDSRIGRGHLRKWSGKLSGLILDRLGLPVELLVGQVDLFHGPCYFLPSSLRCKKVVTIHDLMAFSAPEFLKPQWVADTRRMTETAVRRADLVIAVSNFTKGEIVEMLHIPEDRVRVVCNGVAPVYRPVEDRAAIKQVKARYGIRGPYLLFVGNLEPKKNVLSLIEAWVLLRREGRFQGSLVIVGNKDWYFDDVWQACRRHRVEGEVIFTGVADGDDLPYLYSGAEAFVFPSLYEGFGIPVIEAMACGAPVVASNRTSIPEIASDAALLVDPEKPAEIAAATHSIITDGAVRRRLVEKGLRRAKEFSWERAARETLAVYNELA